MGQKSSQETKLPDSPTEPPTILFSAELYGLIEEKQPLSGKLIKVHVWPSHMSRLPITHYEIGGIVETCEIKTDGVGQLYIYICFYSDDVIYCVMLSDGHITLRQYDGLIRHEIRTIRLDKATVE